MENKYKLLIKDLGREKILQKEPMSKYTSFHIGGPADLFFRASSAVELTNAVQSALHHDIPYQILGGGTNVLVSDEGFRGLIIKNDSSKIQLKGLRYKKIQEGAGKNVPYQGKVYLSVDSGVLVNRLVRYSLDQGLAGLEAFLGQPGTVGGAVYINAHNMHLSTFFGDLLLNAQILDNKGEVRIVDKSYFKFGYDQSILQKTEEILLSVTLPLVVKDKDEVWERAQEAFQYRQATQPKGKYTAGCIFRNIDKSDAMRLSTPQFTCSAGFILERLGLKKKKQGDAQFSSEHANFIINLGNAQAADVLKLISTAKKMALEKYAIRLKEEIVYIGRF